MNKIIIAVVAILVIGGTIFVVNKNGSDNKSNESTQQSSGSQSESNTQESTQQKELDPNNYTQNANVGASVIATDQSEVKISIDDFIFKTTYLKIKKGTKVTWTNDGNIAHTVTSNDSSPKKGLDSKLLGNGESYEFTFNDTGVYEYFCAPHPTQMRGVITVVDK